jgi:hypothetical protein
LAKIISLSKSSKMPVKLKNCHRKAVRLQISDEPQNKCEELDRACHPGCFQTGRRRLDGFEAWQTAQNKNKKPCR